MAYNNGFPISYQPYYNPYYQNQMMQNQMMQHNQQNQQIQQSGFVLVQSEQEARAYPVAPGNSITFKDERQPYCYVKTMGFNQLDQPIFEKYRLVKEEDATKLANAPVGSSPQETDKPSTYALKSDLEALRGDVEALKAKITTEVKEDE